MSLMPEFTDLKNCNCSEMLQCNLFQIWRWIGRWKQYWYGKRGLSKNCTWCYGLHHLMTISIDIDDSQWIFKDLWPNSDASTHLLHSLSKNIHLVLHTLTFVFSHQNCCFCKLIVNSISYLWPFPWWDDIC